MIFLELSKSQLSRDEMRNVNGAGGGLEDDESCFSYCDTVACPIGCSCITLHGASRCYKL